MTNKFLLSVWWILVIGLFSTVVFGQTKTTQSNIKNQPKTENQLLGKWENNEVKDEEQSVEFFENGIMTQNCLKGKYSVAGKVIISEFDQLKAGKVKAKFPFLLKDNILTVWDEGRKLVYTRPNPDSGKIQAETHKWSGGSTPPSFVGEWCDKSNDSGNANSTNTNNCLTFYGNGTYEYFGKMKSRDASGIEVKTEEESGQWSVTAKTFIACSFNGTGSKTTSLEKRNHPQTGAPMLIINGENYVTTDQKRKPW